MHLATSLASTFPTFLMLATITAALPANISSVEKRARDCWDISLATVEFMYQNTCFDPLPATCLFYTDKQSKPARVLAERPGSGITTIWEMWDVEYYDRDVNDQNNVMRCIMDDDDDRQTYFENMSTAMALKCTYFANVMSAQELDEVPKTGIWYNTEYKTLMRTWEENKKIHDFLGDDWKNQVDYINYLKPDGTGDAKYWRRGDENPPKRREAHIDAHADSTLSRRQGSSCGAPKGVETTFDSDGALPVRW